MARTTLADERMIAIHLLRVGQPTNEVAVQLGRSEQWVRKWWQRYQTSGWSGDTDQAQSTGGTPLPSIASIERVLQAAGMTKPRPRALAAEAVYPHLQPTALHQLCQEEIVPHYLTGGTHHLLQCY